jgi:hypothetical protein
MDGGMWLGDGLGTDRCHGPRWFVQRTLNGDLVTIYRDLTCPAGTQTGKRGTCPRFTRPSLLPAGLSARRLHQSETEAELEAPGRF